MFAFDRASSWIAILSCEVEAFVLAFWFALELLPLVTSGGHHGMARVTLIKGEVEQDFCVGK